MGCDSARSSVNFRMAESKHGDAPPLSITSNRVRRKDDEILALESDCDKNIIELIKNAQNTCKETKEAIEIVKDKLQPTREEYKMKSEKWLTKWVD